MIPKENKIIMISVLDGIYQIFMKMENEELTLKLKSSYPYSWSYILNQISTQLLCEKRKSCILEDFWGIIIKLSLDWSVWLLVSGVHWNIIT